MARTDKRVARAETLRRKDERKRKYSSPVTTQTTQTTR